MSDYTLTNIASTSAEIVIPLLGLLSATIIGFFEQQVTYASSYNYHRFFNEFLGFILLLPLFGTLMHRIITVHRMYYRFIIIMYSIVLC